MDHGASTDPVGVGGVVGQRPYHRDDAGDGVD